MIQKVFFFEEHPEFRIRYKWSQCKSLVKRDEYNPITNSWTDKPWIGWADFTENQWLEFKESAKKRGFIEL